MAKHLQPEYRLQVAIADLLRRACRHGIFWTAIDHGEERTKVRLPSGKIICPAADRAARKGVRNGLPDLWFISTGGRSMGLELKTANDKALGTRKGRVSADQENIGEEFKACGATYEVAYGWDEAIAFLVRHGIISASRLVRAA